MNPNTKLSRKLARGRGGRRTDRVYPLPTKKVESEPEEKAEETLTLTINEELVAALNPQSACDKK